VVRECVEWHGWPGRCPRSARSTARSSPVVGRAGEREAQLVELANRCVTENGADVVLFAARRSPAWRARFRDRVTVPLVDRSAPRSSRPRRWVALGAAQAVAGHVPPPAAKGSVGLAPSLAAWLAHE